MNALSTSLIVEETIKEQTTKSGIILPTYGEGYKDGQMTVSTDIVATQAPEAKTGKVLSVGPLAKLVNVGDTVIWSAYSGKELTDGTSSYVALSINDVIAVSRAHDQELKHIQAPLASEMAFDFRIDKDKAKIRRNNG